MAKAAMNDLLKKRMTASQQASELQASDQAYQKLFREAPPPGEVQIRSLPLDKLVPFFTADIGFRPYSPTQLEAFAEQLGITDRHLRNLITKDTNSSCSVVYRISKVLEIPMEVLVAPRTDENP